MVSKDSTGRIGDGHLRARMEFQLRHGPAADADDAHILHDDAVDTDIAEFRNVFTQRRQFIVTHEGIYRHIDPHFVDMDEMDGPPQFFGAEILRILPCSKTGASEIHGIRAGIDGGFESFPGPRRG